MPKYSVEAIPFRWMRRDSYERYSQSRGIELDYSLETAADAVMSYKSGWIQDHRNQLAMLDSFFSALQRRKSLVLPYVKDLPLVEEPQAGERFLVGAGLVDHVDPSVEWEYTEKGPIRSVLWERGVSHSIRPAFTDGFLLPYPAAQRPRLAAPRPGRVRRPNPSRSPRRILQRVRSRLPRRRDRSAVRAGSGH